MNRNLKYEGPTREYWLLFPEGPGQVDDPRIYSAARKVYDNYWEAFADYLMLTNHGEFNIEDAFDSDALVYIR